MRTLRQTQELPISMEKAWEFFATPRNLEVITPPWMKFRIVEGGGEDMKTGQIIVYRIRLAPAIWTDWVTEILDVEPGKRFVDDQRLGPYALWHHTHEFEPVDGGVRMTDTVRYAVGRGPIGKIAHACYVDGAVRKIFDFRREKLAEMFPGD